MRNFTVIATVIAALLIAPAAACAASPGAANTGPTTANQPASATLPLFLVNSGRAVPTGFSTTRDQAVAAAEATPTLQALHRRDHPMRVYAFLWAGKPVHWFVEFWYHNRYVGEVNVSPKGRVLGAWTGPLATTVYARGHYAQLFDSPWVVVPFSLLFLLPFLDPRRLRRMLHLDALVLLSFMFSYWLFDHGHLEPAVWLVYPPLLYLAGRMLVLGRRGAPAAGRLAPLLSSRLLVGGLLVLVCARVALSLAGPAVLDVGYASLLGANRVLHGLSPYFAAAHHADTYGPITYLAYVPFEVLFPWHGTWDYLTSVRVASIFFDLVTIGGLVLIGRRLRPGHAGARLGLALAWAWAACPFTLLNLMLHSNDGLIAMLSVLSLLVFTSPMGRGAVLGLAAAAKFSPAALLPLYAGERPRSRKSVIVCVLSFVVVVALAIGLYLPPGGVSEFYKETIGYQLTRTDVFSPWALHPSLGPVKIGLEVVALLMVVLVPFFPRGAGRRSLTQVCALAAAVTIALQLPAVHWFYYYLLWFIPFVLIALLGRSAEPSTKAHERPAADEPGEPLDKPIPEPVLARV